MLALPRFLWFLVPGFRERLALLLDQGCHSLSDWKLVSDGLDNVFQFIFATSKGTVSIARRNVEIERVIPCGVPGETLLQKPIFIGRQNKKEVTNPFTHSIELIGKSGQ